MSFKLVSFVTFISVTTQKRRLVSMDHL